MGVAQYCLFLVAFSGAALAFGADRRAPEDKPLPTEFVRIGGGRMPLALEPTASAATAVAADNIQVSAEYIPKSFYVIDEDGKQSDVVFIRDRREIPLLRVRRGGGSNAQASAESSASAGAGGGGGGAPIHFDDFIPNLGNLANFARNIPTGGGGSGAGASSFASASSSSSSGGGSGGGYGNSGYAGGLGAGQPAGYNGPVLFSRMGETEGSGGHVSSAALGSRGAFSSSSISTDGEKVKYSSQSGKY